MIANNSSVAARIASPTRVAFFLLGSLALLAGCGREGAENGSPQAQDQQVQAVAPAAPDVQGAPDQAPAEASDWPWTVPQAWVFDPEPRPMRLATYMAPDPAGPVEVAVSRFPGRVGGELSNMNRWRGQMGLDPLDEADLKAAVERFTAPGFDGYLARIDSATGVMLAAGVHEQAIDATWFVRVRVPDAEVADRVETEVFEFARSIAAND